MVTRQECRSGQWRGFSSPLVFSALQTAPSVTAGPGLGHAEGAVCRRTGGLASASPSGQGNLPVRVAAV